MTEAWIIDAVRTPRGVGKVGKGALSHLHPQHLASTVLKALAERNSINTAEVDDVIWGTSTQVGMQGADMGRMAALDAGYDIKASGVTLDRFCGSGITTVNLAAATIMSGQQDMVIAGGCEMMSYTAQLPPVGPRSARRAWTRAICTCAPSIPKATRASAPTPSPRWKASPARMSTRLLWKASAGPLSP